MGFSDIIQPGLIQLQPSFDDFMDTLPSLSGTLLYCFSPADVISVIMYRHTYIHLLPILGPPGLVQCANLKYGSTTVL